MDTDRARQVRFCNDFGARAVDQAIGDLLRRKRLALIDILPDEVLAELVSRMAADWRASQAITLRNRLPALQAAE